MTPTMCRGPDLPLFQAGLANFTFGGDTGVDVANPNRGPLLIIAGANDTTAPVAFTKGSYKKQLKNPEVNRICRGAEPGALP